MHKGLSNTKAKRTIHNTNSYLSEIAYYSTVNTYWKLCVLGTVDFAYPVAALSTVDISSALEWHQQAQTEQVLHNLHHCPWHSSPSGNSFTEDKSCGTIREKEMKLKMTEN